MKSLIKIIITVLITFGIGSGYAAETINNNKELVKKAIIYAIENRDPNLDYSKYISKDYVQHVDGKTFNFAQYVQHMEHIKNILKSMSVFFQDIIAEGNKVVTVHIVKGTKEDGTEMAAKVIALFTVKDGKIVSCDELTHMIKGQEEDRDMGSRQ